MKPNKLSDLTLEELTKQKKQMSAIVGATIAVLLIFLGAMIFLIYRKQNLTLLAILPSAGLALLPGVIRLNQLNAEIKSRGGK